MIARHDRSWSASFPGGAKVQVQQERAGNLTFADALPRGELRWSHVYALIMCTPGASILRNLMLQDNFMYERKLVRDVHRAVQDLGSMWFLLEKAIFIRGGDSEG